jgi:flavin-dependent dehydrogenase
VARRVLATGPFAAWSGRVVAHGAALVGDAADFFDPFTGDGIYCALRGAELLSETVVRTGGGNGMFTATELAPYRRARRRAFAGKWAVERLVGYAMEFPRVFDRAVGRLHRRDMAHTFIGVTGDFVPARAVLNPLFLARMVF